MDRDEKILARISNSMKILEIGPSIAPIVPKTKFDNVFTLDHASKESLIKKYNFIGVNTDRIEDVDFIWESGPIHEVVPHEMHGTFDAVIASHVFEHVPDPITFLQSVGILLRDGGYFSMANPDKRFTFDFLKPLTNTAELIEAFEEKRSRHSRKAILSQRFDSVRNNGQDVWATWIPTGDIDFINPNLAYASPKSKSEDLDYEDCHAWYFTPSSFDLLILELKNIGLIPFEVDLSFPSWGCEFYRTLVKLGARQKGDNSIASERLRLHQLVCEELLQQFEQWKPIASEKVE